jgi:hypothetical protein
VLCVHLKKNSVCLCVRCCSADAKKANVEFYSNIAKKSLFITTISPLYLYYEYLFILTHNMYSNPRLFSECELLYYVYNISIHLFPLASPYPPCVGGGDMTSSYSIPRGCERATGVRSQIQRKCKLQYGAQY